MSQRARGPTVVDPRLSPADTSATARLRLRVNQRVVVATSGAKKLPAATPTSTPNSTWNCPSVAARLAVTRPRPSRTPPLSTTVRVPMRSESAPQTNALTPMDSQLMSAVVEMPVRDQPIASDTGCKNTLSASMAPTPTHVTTMPAPTMNQP
jgi:hypothetical protein